MTEPVSVQDDANRRILEERAIALARPPEVEDQTAMIGVLVLVVGGERYAVAVEHVVGIAPLPEVTPVPGTPAFWAGLINVRGILYPILGLREYLRLPATPTAGTEDEVVLVAAAGLTVGLICDDVSEISWLRPDDIHAPPPPAPGSRAVLRGLTSDLVAVLDLALVLRDPVLTVNDEIS